MHCRTRSGYLPPPSQQKWIFLGIIRVESVSFTPCYRTRRERPMRRMVVDLMPFSRQRFATVVP